MTNLLSKKLLGKKLLSFVAALMVLVASGLGWARAAQAYPAVGQLFGGFVNQGMLVLGAEVDLENEADAKILEAAGKVDLNNTNIRAFLDYPGLYPTLAGKVIAGAPYERVEDVLKLSGLSERQSSTLKKYLDKFTVTEPSSALTEGFDRINNGAYR
jgi:photosystem II PsbU protein